MIESGFDSDQNGIISENELNSIFGVSLNSEYIVTDIDTVFSFPNINSVSISDISTLSTVNVKSSEFSQLGFVNCLFDSLLIYNSDVGSISTTNSNFSCVRIDSSSLGGNGIEFSNLTQIIQPFNMTLNSSFLSKLELVGSGLDTLFMRGCTTDYPQFSSIRNDFVAHIEFDDSTSFGHLELCNNSNLSTISLGHGATLDEFIISNCPIEEITGSVYSADIVELSYTSIESSSSILPFFGNISRFTADLYISHSPVWHIEFSPDFSYGFIQVQSCSTRTVDFTRMDVSSFCRTDYHFPGIDSLKLCITDSLVCDGGDNIYVEESAYVGTCLPGLEFNEIAPWYSDLSCQYPQILAVSALESVVLIDSTQQPSHPFYILDEIPSEFQPGVIYDLSLEFRPEVYGTYSSSIMLYTNSYTPEQMEPYLYVVELIGYAAPQYPTINDLVVQIDVSDNVHLDWSPILLTECGEQRDPDHYLVFYSEGDPFDSESYYFLAATTTSEFVHGLAARYSDRIAYQVEAVADVTQDVLDGFVGQSKKQVMQAVRRTEISIQ